MLSKTTLFIILSFFQMLTVKSALIPLSSERGIDHFFKITHKFLNQYKSSDLESGIGIKSTRYENKDIQTSHVIDVMIEKNRDGFQYGFFNAKKADIFKQVREYFEEEFNLQAAAFEELVSRLIVLGKSSRGKEVIYFNTIEDVKQRILGLSDAKAKLTFDEEIKNDQVFLTLKSNAEVLALFTLTIKDENGDKNYYIDIDFTISNDNFEVTQNTKVYMFEKDEKNFSIAMSAITDKLDINSYVNNLEIAEVQFKKFMKKYFGYIHVGDLPENSSSTTSRKFKLTFEKQTADCELLYIAPILGNSDKVASYQITINRGGSQFSRINFKRMSIKVFEEYLKNLGLDKLFEDLWTKIKRIFKEKFEKQYSAISSNTIFMESQKKAYFYSKPEHFFTAKVGGSEVMSISHTIADDNKWTLSWNSDRSEMEHVRLEFDKEHFNTSVLEDFFDMILRSHNSLTNPQRNLLL